MRGLAWPTAGSPPAGAAAWRLTASSSVSLVMPCGRGGGLLAGSRDGRGVVAAQDAVGVPDDAGGGCGDAVPDGEDGGGGLGAWVSTGPACRVGEVAAGGNDAVPGAGDEATALASALRSPVQPVVVVPGG